MTWSTTVVMKIDLVGPTRRGTALGFNEAAGYGAVSLTAVATGAIAARYGLRPEPFFLGIAFAALGLGLSTLFVRETQGHARLEAAHTRPRTDENEGFAAIFARTTWRDPTLGAVSQAGLVNNAVDGLAWGILPLFASDGLSVGAIGVLAAPLPGRVVRSPALHRRVVGPRRAQAADRRPHGGAGHGAGTGAHHHHRVRRLGRGAVAIGTRTALVYPTLIAAVGDVAHPTWRATAVGVYRLWRDSGYVVAALLGGVVADLLDLRAAVMVAAGLSVASGLVVAARMEETAGAPRSGGLFGLSPS